ncbi:FAD-binding oxidoreductase [candidate division KSB1 bacterium]|nr:FAD-binding oxidoreductase [candidate division KSB1 bacterium]
MIKDPLKIAGDISQAAADLDQFSRDASSYRLQPRLVIAPKDEMDVQQVVRADEFRDLPLTPRGGGSGLSGAGIGSGIIFNFKKYMHRVLAVGDETVVQPGAVLDAFLKQMSHLKVMLPAVPSSRAWCTLGGNVGTRSTGPRTARYGTIDDFVTSLRFVTAQGEIIDTRAALPTWLAEGLNRIQADYRQDLRAQQIVNQRPYIAGGYNLRALEQYADVRDLATHLLVGSVGTLGIITGIRLKLIPYTPSQGTFVAHFKNIHDFAAAANRLKSLNPAALEFVDAFSVKFLAGKVLNYPDPNFASILIVEFDESPAQAAAGLKLVKSYDLAQLLEISADSDLETALWAERRNVLPALWKYARANGWVLPSIVDDVAIHLPDLGSILQELGAFMSHSGHPVAFFGHAGFGSIHARPFFRKDARDLIEQMVQVSQTTFKILQPYHGTLVGEHNAGRSRSIYLIDELGPAYHYLERIKNLFDPTDRLNPGTIFKPAPIYMNLNLEI